MHPTKGYLVFSSVIALFRFALTVLLLRNQHGLQIAKNLCTTSCRPTRTFRLPHTSLQTCNENSSVHQNQKSKRNSHYRFAHSLLCAGCALNCLRPQDLQIYTGKSKFHIPTISPSANWTYLAGKPRRKKKFWPERRLWNRPSFPRPQAIRWMSNMRWISSPNSYQNIKICSKHSWKMDHSIHIDFGRRSNIKTQTNLIWAAFRFSMIFSKRRKEMITMF